MIHSHRKRIFGVILLCLFLGSIQTSFAGRPNLIPKEVQTEDGLILEGHLALPETGAAPYPVVLLLVGSGKLNRYEGLSEELKSLTADNRPTVLFQPIADALLSRGIAVFAYDKRGVHSEDFTFLKNTIDESLFQTGTARTLASDALRAYDTLKEFPEIDPTRIGILGHSEGALLATQIAELRPEVSALFMMGIPTRPFKEITRYQTVTARMRLFHLMDQNRDGYVDQNEYAQFSAETTEQSLEPNLQDSSGWEQILAFFDSTSKQKVAEQAWRYLLETLYNAFVEVVLNTNISWTEAAISPMPRSWYKELFDAGSFLERHANFCKKIYLFQGNIDVQTPYEDALALRDTCKSQGTPLPAFQTYADLGHGFSPRAGRGGWRDTLGPLDLRVAEDIATEASKALRTEGG